MKIVINYDFFNAILDVNEDFTPMKIVRNNKKTFAVFGTSFFLLDYTIIRNVPSSLFLSILQSSGICLGHYAYNYFYNTDIFKEDSIERLKNLVKELNNQYINTDFNLLLQSEYLEKKYKVCLNKLKLPELMEYKYILVPTYDFNGNIKKTSIEQEHVIGTDEYVLSLGSPKKELKLVHSRI